MIPEQVETIIRISTRMPIEGESLCEDCRRQNYCLIRVSIKEMIERIFEEHELRYSVNIGTCTEYSSVLPANL
jgi:hypothetical protein